MKNRNKNENIYPLTEIQQKIINIASKKFAKNGFQKTSLNEIAEAAKISKGTLFYHYPSKENLFFVSLSNSIDSAFKDEFEFYAKHGFKLFQNRKNLLDDLRTYYDLRIAKPLLVERLWLEGILESEHNPKFQQMLSKKDDQIVQTMTSMLNAARNQIGILEGFSEKELFDIAKGLAAFFRGIFLYKLMKNNPDSIRDVWIQTVYMIYTSKKIN